MANRNQELLKAVRKNDLEKVKDCLENSRYGTFFEGGSDTYYNSADIGACDDRGNTAWLLAAELGYRSIVQYLLTRRINVSQVNKAGETALMLAARGGFKAIMQDLIAKGASLGEKNNAGKTPLIYAADNKQGMTVKFIIEQKADVNDPDNDGKTPLMYAAQNQDVVSVNALLDAAANIDAQDNKGYTALMHSLNRDSGDAAGEALLARNARTDIMNNEGSAVGDMNFSGWIAKYMARAKTKVTPEDTLKKAFIAEGIDITKPEQWNPIGEVAIDCIAASLNSPKILSTIFNFETQQYTSVVKNVLTGEKVENAGALDSFSNPELVVSAYQKLKAMGKNPPPLRGKSFPL